jgi:hypothetical protein
MVRIVEDCGPWRVGCNSTSRTSRSSHCVIRRSCTERPCILRVDQAADDEHSSAFDITCTRIRYRV